jgi:hypothetical protein
MTPLLQRLVEKARNPQGARSELKPLVAPLYGPSAAFSDSEPGEERHPDQTAPLDAAHDSFQRSFARAGDVEDAAGKNHGLTVRLRAPIHDAEEATLPRLAQQLTPQQVTPLRMREPLLAETVRASATGKVAAISWPTPAPDTASAKPASTTLMADGPPAAEQFNSPRQSPLTRTELKPLASPHAEISAQARQRDVATNDARVLPPQITVSIGHIEVRAAQAPAAERPRRPEFRPSLSLAEFLDAPGRGRS